MYSFTRESLCLRVAVDLKKELDCIVVGCVAVLLWLKVSRCVAVSLWLYYLSCSLCRCGKSAKSTIGWLPGLPLLRRFPGS